MIKAILFDMDGVLIDSFESNLKFFQDILGHFGYKKPTREEYEKCFHLPTVEVIKKLTHLADEKKIQEINDFAMSDDFPYSLLAPTVPENAIAILRNLAKKYKLGIVTSRTKKWVFEAPELEKNKNLFSVVMAYEDTKNHKPHPEPLLVAAKKLNVQPSECVYIGDAPTDRKAGEAAGMRVIMYSHKTIEGIKVDTRTFAEIPNIIENLL